MFKQTGCLFRRTGAFKATPPKPGQMSSYKMIVHQISLPVAGLYCVYMYIIYVYVYV